MLQWTETGWDLPAGTVPFRGSWSCLAPEMEKVGPHGCMVTARPSSSSISSERGLLESPRRLLGPVLFRGGQGHRSGDDRTPGALRRGTPARRGLTLASCVCSLFFMSISSEMRAWKARLVSVYCFHIWSDKFSNRCSASSRSRIELARVF